MQVRVENFVSLTKHFVLTCIFVHKKLRLFCHIEAILWHQIKPFGHPRVNYHFE